MILLGCQQKHDTPGPLRAQATTAKQSWFFRIFLKAWNVFYIGFLQNLHDAYNYLYIHGQYCWRTKTEEGTNSTDMSRCYLPDTFQGKSVGKAPQETIAGTVLKIDPPLVLRKYLMNTRPMPRTLDVMKV